MPTVPDALLVAGSSPSDIMSAYISNVMNNLLCVLLDLSPQQWHLSRTAGLALDDALAQILVFLNAHIALKHENALAVYGAFPANSVLLYSSTDPPPPTPDSSANTFPAFQLVDSSVVDRIHRELGTLSGDGGNSNSNDNDNAPSGMVGCLTKALCYINRLTQSNQSNSDPNLRLDPRILILSISPDLSTSYISIMNAIFSAQKLKVTIDVCQLYGPDTVFFQQAAHLTGGSYVTLETKDALLQYLMMAFLSPPSVRNTLSVPTQEKIDLRATCFCHKNIIDIGFVCSVCLSIFCNPIPVCSTCRTKFPMKTLQRLNASRPLKNLPTSNGNSRSATPPTSGLPNSNLINVNR